MSLKIVAKSKARNEMESGYKGRTSKVQTHIIPPQGKIKQDLRKIKEFGLSWRIQSVRLGNRTYRWSA